MRRLLGVLRDQAGGEALAPLPGLDRLGVLVQQVRDAGLTVDLTDERETPDVTIPQGVDVSAYRIVQEALTNALKHAGPAHVRIAVRRLDAAVDIEVVDDGRGLAAHLGDDGGGSGHGLVGMRERVALFGGTLEAGPRLGGGFRVHARLPLDAAAHLVGGAP
jgi:signal transduction histidine kinase